MSTICNLDLTVTTFCPASFTGTIPLHGACFRSEECAGDAWCDPGAGRMCPGTCAPRVAPGAPCTDVHQCSTAGFSGIVTCQPTGTSGAAMVCLQHRLATAAVEGQPCGAVVSGTTVTDTPCADNLTCVPATGLCQRVTLAQGQPCTADTPCPFGDACVTDALGASTCQAASYHNHPGDPCAANSTALCNPVIQLACRNGTCQLVGDGSAGSACATGEFANTACNPGLYCDGATRVCTPQKPAGAPCLDNLECAGVCGPGGLCADRACNLRYCLVVPATRGLAPGARELA